MLHSWKVLVPLGVLGVGAFNTLTYTGLKYTAATNGVLKLDRDWRTAFIPASDIGIFGTLEQCQERVQELAHAGVTDLRCVVPNSADVHDVIAQLTAIAVGTVDVFVPGAPRSKAPEPPPSWGGRRSEP